MKKTGLVAIVAIVLMMFPLFALTVRAASPWNPSNATAFFEGQIGWGPVEADPALCYDSLSGELLFNSYQGLLACAGEQYYDFVPALATNIPTRQDITLTLANTSAVRADATGSTWTDGATAYTCVGWINETVDGVFGTGDVVYLTDGTAWRTWTVDAMTGMSMVTLSLWRGSYVFNIRTSPIIYFYNETGDAVDTFDVTDAAYSFQRALVVDQLGSPIWTYDKPLFDLSDHLYFTNATAMDLAHLIGNAVEANTTANTLTLNVGFRIPDTAFKQALANTWGSICSKEFSVSIGCWDGSLYTTAKYGGPFPDWWIDWAGGYSDSPYDGRPHWRYCGTGPYHVAVIDSVDSWVILEKNPGFWQGWPATGCNGSLDTITIEYISDWVGRRDAFTGGWLDTCAVPRNHMFELLDNTTKEPAIPGIETICNISPELSMDAFMFNLDIKTDTYIGTGTFPDGIYPDFFNNTHVRKAFAYSFNHTAYGQQVFFGESSYRKNFLIPGLVPDYYNDTNQPGYDINYTAAENELKAARVNVSNVWDAGFTVNLMYQNGDDEKAVACSMVRNFFLTLSTYDGREGRPPFTVNVRGVIWLTLTEGFICEGNLPMFDIGYHAEIVDADSFARSYMYSNVTYANLQGYTAANGWGNTKDQLVDQALQASDGPTRQALYNQLALIYYNDCPSFPINSPTDRRWCWYWVKGWYFDALYPGSYYYTMWKADDCWYDVSGLTPGVSDGIVNMKDNAYLVAHFNAHAPVPGMPIDPKWVGVYGANGCVDPYGDRVCNMKDISGVVAHFNHRMNTGTP